MKFRLSPGAVVLSALLFIVPAFAQQDSKNTSGDSAPSAKQGTPDQKTETPTDQESSCGQAQFSSRDFDSRSGRSHRKDSFGSHRKSSLGPDSEDPY